MAQRRGMGVATSPVRRWRIGLAAWALAVAMSVMMVGEARAQDTTVSQWRIFAGVGVEEVASRDEKGSPLAYGGRAVPLWLGAHYEGGLWSGGAELSGFAFAFNGGQLRSALAEHGAEGNRADSVFIDVSLWGQRQILDWNAHRLSTGLQLSHWTFFRSYHYDPAQIGGVETWDAPITADARLQWDRVGEHVEWRLAVNAALAGRMLRPAHSLRGDERFRLIESRRHVLGYGRWVSVTRLQWAQARASLRWRLGDRWALVSQYRLGWLQHRASERSRASSHRWTTGIQWQF